MSMTFVDSWGVPMSGWYDSFSLSPTLKEYDRRLGNLEWHCHVRSNPDESGWYDTVAELNGEAHGRD